MQSKDEALPSFTFKLKPGAKFPSFKLTTTDGRTVDNSVLLGHSTLINFFFGECGPCIKEVPALNTFARKHPDIKVMAITFDELGDAKSFSSKTNFHWQIAVDAKKLLDTVGVVAYPSFALIDAKGVLVAIGIQSDIFAQSGGLDDWVRQRSSTMGTQ